MLKVAVVAAADLRPSFSGCYRGKDTETTTLKVIIFFKNVRGRQGQKRQISHFFIDNTFF